MIRPVLLALAVALAIAASGCINPTTSTGQGIAILSFKPGLTEVYPEEPVEFSLSFQNQGSVTARGVYAELLGLDEDWGSSSSGISGNDNLYVGGEILPQEEPCRYTSSEHYTLSPPEPSYGTPGESGTCTWKYKAPNVPQGMNPSYAVTARVYYEYRTDVIKSFTIYPSSELLALNQQGKPIPSSTVSSTQSPISITADAREPIRFWEGGQISFPLSITVANTGGGTVCLTGRCKRSEGADWNELNLVIIPVSAGLSVSSECAEYEGGAFSPGEAISVSGLSLSGGILEVWPNRPNTIICDIIVSGLGASTEEKTLQVSAEYSYFTDAKSSITII